LSKCVLNPGESIAYCERGKCVLLPHHSVNVLSIMLGAERLRTPIESAARAFDQTIPSKLSEGRFSIVIGGAIIAGAFHDIGKACAEYSSKCSKEGEVSFFGHEVLGSAILLAAATIACADDAPDPAAALVLASYATLMHHHKTTSGDPELLSHNVVSRLKGRACTLLARHFLLSVTNLVRDYTGLYYPEGIAIVGEALYFIYEAISVMGSRTRTGRVSLWKAARAVKSANLYKVAKALLGEENTCVDRVVSITTQSLFGKSPDPIYGNLVRMVGVSIIGSLSAANTLAASMEGRVGTSVLSERIVRELLGD